MSANELARDFVDYFWISLGQGDNLLEKALKTLPLGREAAGSMKDRKAADELLKSY
jgi:hypothetical protein